MKTGDDAYKAAYRDEAEELLAELEGSLLELEEIPGDMDLIGKVFRAMHTIKGSGAMFGFDDIAAFTHDVETVFDAVRNAKIPVTGDLIDLTLKARDCIRMMLDHAYNGEPPDRQLIERVSSSFKALAPKSGSKSGKTGKVRQEGQKAGQGAGEAFPDHLSHPVPPSQRDISERHQPAPSPQGTGRPWGKRRGGASRRHPPYR